MTEPSSEGQWPVGSIANNHLRTSTGWIPFVWKTRADGPPWSPGDLVDGHVMTEAGTWVSAAEPTSAASVAAPLYPIPPPPVTHRERWQRLHIVSKVGAIGALGLLILLLVSRIAVAVENRTTSSAPSLTPTAKPNAAKTTSPKPARTTAVPDPSIKYAADMKKQGWTELTDGLWGKWDTSSSDSFYATFNMRVVSPKGCSNGVYLEANVMDTSDTVVGFVNDMLPSLPANQQAVLQLTSTASGQLEAQITKANCY